MGKTSKQFGSKMRTRTVGGGAKGKRQDLKLDETPSNEVADKQAQMIYIGLTFLSILLVGGALYWAFFTLLSGVSGGHLNWAAIIAGSITIGVCIFLTRTLAWLSYFGAIIYAMKTNAWQSQQRLCRSALKLWRLFPGGSSTAALMLVQSLVSRGQFDEAIAVGQEQFNLHGKDPKFNESLAPMYSSLGMAYQVKGDPKESIVWTERGIEAMERALTQIAEKKTWQAKLAGPQGIEWAKQLRMQLCVAYFNNASSYFNQMNYRQARQLYKQTLDHSNQAPEFPEKAEIVRVSKEQMQRLKHS